MARARRIIGIKPKKELEDSAEQANQDAAEDWRKMDIAKVLRQLHNPKLSLVRKALIRWWHATTEQLRQTLKAAGAAPRAINCVPEVVNAYQIYRNLRKPSNRTVLPSSLSTEFNHNVQFDLMFYTSLIEPDGGNRPIIHLIDACLRWSATKDSGGKSDEVLPDGISTTWIAVYGPMSVLTLDQESSLRGKAADDWAIQNQATLYYNAPRLKAWLVERHNEILRQGLHRAEQQILKESLVTSFKIVLALAAFMHNALIVIHKHTPYNVLFGRQPTIFPPLEGGYHKGMDSNGNPTKPVGQLDADSLHDLSHEGQRCLARVRAISAAFIIEATALARLDRADRHNTVAAQEFAAHAVGDLVDIWYEPHNKDTSGWRGPAQIPFINEGEGNTTVRFQGGTLDRRCQEVRHHIHY